jgi:hypothetical protein
MNETLFLDICKENYLALIKMLERTITLCPDELWADNSLKPQFWKEVYHTIYYLDFYLGNNWKKKPDRFDIKENLGEIPEKILTKEDLQSYLEETREKCVNVLDNLTNDDLEKKPSHFWTGATLSHKLIYNIRHSQHHVGKINVILTSNGIDAAEWIIDPEKK